VRLIIYIPEKQNSLESKLEGLNLMNEKDKKVVEFLKAQRLFMVDKVRYHELTDLISAFEDGVYSADMSEEELPHKVWLNIQMALGGWFE
jgi:hypothetical protein